MNTSQFLSFEGTPGLILLGALALVGLIGGWVKSGLAEARRKGRKLGRPQGSTASEKEFLSKHSDIVRRLKEGHSVRNTAKITGKGGSTVQRVKALL